MVLLFCVFIKATFYACVCGKGYAKPNKSGQQYCNSILVLRAVQTTKMMYESIFLKTRLPKRPKCSVTFPRIGKFQGNLEAGRHNTTRFSQTRQDTGLLGRSNLDYLHQVRLCSKPGRCAKLRR